MYSSVTHNFTTAGAGGAAAGGGVAGAPVGGKVGCGVWSLGYGGEGLMFRV